MSSEHQHPATTEMVHMSMLRASYRECMRAARTKEALDYANDKCAQFTIQMDKAMIKYSCNLDQPVAPICRLLKNIMEHQTTLPRETKDT